MFHAQHDVLELGGDQEDLALALRVPDDKVNALIGMQNTFLKHLLQQQEEIVERSKRDRSPARCAVAHLKLAHLKLTTLPTGARQEVL